MTFSDWKNGPAADVLQRAFGFDVTQCVCWDDYTRRLLDHRATLGGNEVFVERANKWAGRFCSGERLLLAAALQAADYAWLGDELLDNKFLQKVWVVGGDPFALAVAAPILRID